MTSPKLSPPVIGQAEQAHRAILDHILASTGTTFEQWIALNLGAAASRVPRDAVVERLSGALKVPAADGVTAIEQLISDELVEVVADDPISIGVTEAGQLRYRAIRSEVDRVTARLYADIPADELATAGRVLALVTQRANSELDILSA